MTTTKIHSVESFYNSLSEDYDLMTGDKTRWSVVKEQYLKLLEQFKPQNILDAGCGTGGESILLGELGYSVMGVDLSPKFIKIAQSKSRSMQSNIKFTVDDIRFLSAVDDSSNELITCRGNTLPHLKEVSDLRAALKSFKRVIQKDGLLILQWLNYPLVQKKSERLIGVTGVESSPFVRFYDFKTNDTLVFNILQLHHDEKWKSEWLSTELRAWSGDDVGMLMAEIGWNNIEIASDIERTDFDPDNSKNIVMFATG